MVLHRKKLAFAMLFLFVLSGCGESDNNSAAGSSNGVKTDKSSDEVFAQAKENLVFINGGKFYMGDNSGLTAWDFNVYVGKKHAVRLDDFYIGAYKVTNEDFQVFLKDKNIKLDYKLSAIRQKMFTAANSYPELPAHMYWQEAYDYCDWLAEGTGLSFSLPTEAQWEYVAMEGGKSVKELGKIRRSWYSNSASFPRPEDRWNYAEKIGSGLGYEQALPGDSYPPNTLGVYDLLTNGAEWLSDWYDPEYYDYSPEDNPQGPSEPRVKELYDYMGDPFGKRVYNMKSTRGGIYSPMSISEMIVIRDGFPLEFPARLLNSTVRCVVNQPGILQ